VPEPVEGPSRAQPRDLEPIQTPFEGAVSGYDVSYDDAPVREAPTAEPTAVVEALAEAPLAASEPDAGPPPDAEARERIRRLAVPDAKEMHYQERKLRRVKEPDGFFEADLVSFLATAEGAKGWVPLAAGLAILGALFRALIALRPPL
jgi:hypothetical protein